MRIPPNFWPMPVVVKRLDRSMPFGREVDLGPGDIVLDEDPPKGTHSPLFWTHVYCSRTVARLSYC